MATSDYYRKFPPRGKFSKMAVDLISVVNDNAISKLEGADLLTIPAIIDESLQEVRDVLGNLRMGSGANIGCWCVENPTVTREPSYQHRKECQRARALLAKMEVR